MVEAEEPDRLTKHSGVRLRLGLSRTLEGAHRLSPREGSP